MVGGAAGVVGVTGGCGTAGVGLPGVGLTGSAGVDVAVDGAVTVTAAATGLGGAVLRLGLAGAVRAILGAAETTAIVNGCLPAEVGRTARRAAAS